MKSKSTLSLLFLLDINYVKVPERKKGTVTNVIGYKFTYLHRSLLVSVSLNLQTLTFVESPNSLHSITLSSCYVQLCLENLY